MVEQLQASGEINGHDDLGSMANGHEDIVAQESQEEAEEKRHPLRDAQELFPRLEPANSIAFSEAALESTLSNFLEGAIQAGLLKRSDKVHVAIPQFGEEESEDYYYEEKPKLKGSKDEQKQLPDKTLGFVYGYMEKVLELENVGKKLINRPTFRMFALQEGDFFQIIIQPYHSVGFANFQIIDPRKKDQNRRLDYPPIVISNRAEPPEESDYVCIKDTFFDPNPPKKGEIRTETDEDQAEEELSIDELAEQVKPPKMEKFRQSLSEKVNIKELLKQQTLAIYENCKRAAEEAGIAPPQSIAVAYVVFINLHREASHSNTASLEFWNVKFVNGTENMNEKDLLNEPTISDFNSLGRKLKSEVLPHVYDQAIKDFDQHVASKYEALGAREVKQTDQEYAALLGMNEEVTLALRRRGRGLSDEEVKVLKKYRKVITGFGGERYQRAVGQTIHRGVFAVFNAMVMENGLTEASIKSARGKLKQTLEDFTRLNRESLYSDTTKALDLMIQQISSIVSQNGRRTFTPEEFGAINDAKSLTSDSMSLRAKARLMVKHKDAYESLASKPLVVRIENKIFTPEIILACLNESYLATPVLTPEIVAEDSRAASIKPLAQKEIRAINRAGTFESTDEEETALKKLATGIRYRARQERILELTGLNSALKRTIEDELRKPKLIEATKFILKHGLESVVAAFDDFITAYITDADSPISIAAEVKTIGSYIKDMEKVAKPSGKTRKLKFSKPLPTVKTEQWHKDLAKYGKNSDTDMGPEAGSPTERTTPTQLSQDRPALRLRTMPVVVPEQEVTEPEDEIEDELEDDEESAITTQTITQTPLPIVVSEVNEEPTEAEGEEADVESEQTSERETLPYLVEVLPPHILEAVKAGDGVRAFGLLFGLRPDEKTKLLLRSKRSNIYGLATEVKGLANGFAGEPNNQEEEQADEVPDKDQTQDLPVTVNVEQKTPTTEAQYTEVEQAILSNAPTELVEAISTGNIDTVKPIFDRLMGDKKDGGRKQLEDLASTNGLKVSKNSPGNGPKLYTVLKKLTDKFSPQTAETNPA